MSIPLRQRVPENSPGDFYVEAGLCTSCCLVHAEAPDLLNDPAQDFRECYFRRQPRTPAEVGRAIDAICISEMCALRYAGTDPAIIRALNERGSGDQCDQLPEEDVIRAPIRRRAPAAAAAGADEPRRRPLWQKLFGGGADRD